MLNRSNNNENSIAYWCVVNGSDLWCENGELPLGTAQELALPEDKAVCIGHFAERPVMWLNDSHVERELPMLSLRELLDYPEALFLLCSRAVQFGHMTQTQRFCGQCGGRNHFNHSQLAMQCTECRTMHYPRIFPCVIVAVRKDDKILLAQHPRHRGGMYTVIAGFVEAGETLEQCVAREVKEETGIETTNIRYFGSQPWAFPSSMMMAFLADYQSGEVKPDYTELTDAGWYGPDEIPLVAPEGTIARDLIEQTLDSIRSDMK
jgi:NAD+ diphosphatase